MGKRILHQIGYWRDPDGHDWWGPDPTKLVDPSWAADDRFRVAIYLRSAPRYSSSFDYSFCRFDCGVADKEMGSATLTDGAWVWPEGLHHYVEVHQICLPDAFLEHLIQNDFRIPRGFEGLSDADWQSTEASMELWDAWAVARGAVSNRIGTA